MKRFLILAMVSCTAVAFADKNLQDFEGTASPTALNSTWLPDFSGTSVGVDGTDDAAIFSNEQAHAGTQSGKLSWDWDGTATPGVVRIQPTADVNNNAQVDHTAEPYIGMFVYGASQGDDFQLYMKDSVGYNSFTTVTPITANGWQLVQRNILTDPVVGWVTGDGTLDPNCFWQGFFVKQHAPNNTRVDYYLDDIAFTAASRGASGVSNWSVY